MLTKGNTNVPALSSTKISFSIWGKYARINRSDSSINSIRPLSHALWSKRSQAAKTCPRHRTKIIQSQTTEKRAEVVS